MREASKWILVLLGAALAAGLACGPGLREASVTVTTFVDADGRGTLPETFEPLPGTLVVAKWNVHGNMIREVQLTDAGGRAVFDAGFTHFFDVSVFPPCGYYSTGPLQRDVTEARTAAFGFWPDDPPAQGARVRLLLWSDSNSNGVRDPQEAVAGERISILFGIPGGVEGNLFDTDNFSPESADGWYDLDLGNSCGTIHALLANGERETVSVEEPGRVSDAGSHGNEVHAAIEVRYGPGETTVYWEIR